MQKLLPAPRNHSREDIIARSQTPKYRRNDHSDKEGPWNDGQRRYEAQDTLPRAQRVAQAIDFELNKMVEGNPVFEAKVDVEPEAVSSENLDEAPEDNVTLKYHRPADGQELLDREAAQGEHLLDSPDNREAWTYGDPAKVFPRLHK